MTLGDGGDDCCVTMWHWFGHYEHLDEGKFIYEYFGILVGQITCWELTNQSDATDAYAS